MAWGWRPDGTLWCDQCGGEACVPCPVDHANEPDNEEDDYGPYFHCPACDYMPPTPDGSDDGEPGGVITCPECEGGGREDTFQDADSVYC